MKSGKNIKVYQFKLEDLNQKYLKRIPMTKEEQEEFDERWAKIKKQTENYYK